MDIERFFGHDAQQRIAAAVRDAEATSRGQIVPFVIEKADAYPEARYRGALVAAILATATALALQLPLTIAELPLLQIVAAAAGALVAMWDPVERLLIGRRAMEEAVRARAVEAFRTEGLQRTAEGTGVLVFASLFERQAVVLGDKGIDARMGADWSRVAQALAAGMKARDPARGFVDAIALCGARLTEHFPRQAGAAQRNELEDALRRGDT